MDEISGVPDWGRLTWPRRTERLTLRPATADDAEAMFTYRSISSVAQWMTKLPTELGAWRADFGHRFPYALMIELDGEVVGDLFLKTENAWAQAEARDAAKDVVAEIGWCLTPAHEGRGLATEAVRELLAVAFDGLDLRRVVANCFADNEPSWRLMERVGLRREAHSLRSALHRDGEWYDELSYALLAEEHSHP